MQCPRDQSTLATFEVDELSLETCPTCKGLWFENDELRQAKDHAEPHLDWLDFEMWRHEEHFEVEAQGHACPSCNKPMVALRYGASAVRVDSCPSCKGLWLDADEFQGLLAALHEEASGKPAAEYLLRTLKEALDVLTSPRHLVEEWRDFKHVYDLLKLRLMVERPALMKAIERAQKSTPF